MAKFGISRLTARPILAVVPRYGLAVSLVAVALGTALIQRHYDSLPRFISHFTLIAIAITFWYAGTGPGLLALLLSCLGSTLLERNHFLAPDFPLEYFVILYSIFSLLVGWFSAIRRRAERLLTEARDNLEFRVTERTGEFTKANEQLQNTQAELRSRETYLAEAQKLSHTGSFGWSVLSGEIYWSEETYNIFEYDRAAKPTWDLALQRIHPDDRDRVQKTIERSSNGRADFDIEHRLLMPDGSVKHLHVSARALENSSGNLEHGNLEHMGAVTDVTEQMQSRTKLENAFEEIKQLKDRLQNENVALREEIDRASMFEEIVGISSALHAVLSRVSKVAPTDSTVLITGETGTGKELIARAVHRRSQRSSQAFVSVNCAAIPRDLIASELFGHEKGAFTGATQRRLGRFELAEGGTIFLDEIGELPTETQIALLRVLQEHEFERVGGTGSIRTNVRVIAATNRDLQAAIAKGAFRSDLFYRFNVFPIEVPPLRERREDIPVLVEYFVDRYARKAGKSIRGVNTKSLQLLQSFPWPGNIRELQNVIERSVIVCDTENFSVDESWLSRQPLGNEPKSQLELSQKLACQEKELIETALRESGGRVSGPLGAAAKLGIPGSTLDSKIRSLKINKNRFKTSDPSTERI